MARKRVPKAPDAAVPATQPSHAEESAAESLFRATYGRSMTSAERRQTVSRDKPIPLDEWMKESQKSKGKSKKS